MSQLAFRARPRLDGKALPSTGIESPDGDDHPIALWLTIVEQRKAWMVPLPESGDLHIGRDMDCAIVLASPSVSRSHAVLSVRHGAVSVKDLGSANGTRISGGRVPSYGEQPVPPGVALLIGVASLVVHRLGAGAGIEEEGRGRNGAGREAILASEHIRALQWSGQAVAPSHTPLVVQSEPMRKLFERVDEVAAGTNSVLLKGETGVGKTVVAAAIHGRSPRKGRPFICFNCAAAAENQLETELEMAAGGTVLLGDVGEMPLTVQAKLLHVIETHEVIPLGGTRVRKLDVRFLAASHQDLHERVRRGRFREDLYARLSGMTLEIPPLRERREEIAPLATLFAVQAAAALGREPSPTLSPEAMRFLERQPWPGNVRDLRNCVERAILLSSSELLTEADVDPSREGVFTAASRQVEDPIADSAKDTSQFDERERIQAALAACAGDQTHAAAMLGISRRTLVKKMAELGVARPQS